MGSSAIRDIFEGVIVLSATASVLVLWLSSRKRAQEHEQEQERASSRWLSVLAHPLTMFAFVCFVIFLNQIAFNAYVLRAHGGSPSFVARYLPGGWFALSRGAVVRFVAGHVGDDGSILAPSVLNVQAFLELPFVLTAYLAVTKMLGGRVYYALTRWPVLLLASASFTVTFSLVELSVPNPWTSSDVIIRFIAGATVPFLLAFITRNVPACDDARRPRTVVGLFAFLIGAAAMAWTVLAIYDSFLLYNFGHLEHYAPGLVIAFALMAVCAVFARVVGVSNRKQQASSRVIDCSRDVIATFTTVFFVPSLVLRYQGYRSIAIFCGFLVVAFALVLGLRRGVRGLSLLATAKLALSLLIGLVAGGVAAVIAATFSIDVTNLAVGEEALARVAIAFLGVTIVGARAVEMVLPSSAAEAEAATPTTSVPTVSSAGAPSR